MKIICIGRNYVEHIKELNNIKESNPLIFLKPETAIQPKNHPFFIPDFSDDIHYELEILLKICKLGKNIEEKFAYKYYNEIGLGIDFTARDLQNNLKIKGKPWEIAKGFDGSAKISNEFINKNELILDDIDFSLRLNNEIVQSGNSSEMIFSFDKIISHVSKFFTLKIGDIIFTGTPAGVGRIKKNDFLEGFLNGKKMLEVKIK